MATVSTTQESEGQTQPDADPLVSVVIPCLDEAETIATCVRKACASLDRMGVAGEVVVADNGSSDGSQKLATEAGARVVDVPERGYGNAYLGGFAAARGRYIVMGDGDDTYNFDEVERFVKPMEEGADMVMGSRLKGRIHKGAMPWLHRRVGNPVLTRVLNLFYRSGISDAHCGMRGIRRDVLPRLDLRTPGMEFASEMVIRAAKEDLNVVEIPIELHPRGGGEAKLNTWSDGWRHLRFLLIHSPTYLFMVPGLIALCLGLIVTAVTSTGPINVFGRQWDIHVMIAGAMMTIIGSQLLQLGFCARAYGVYHMGERDRLFEKLSGRMRLEHGLMAGALVFLLGLGLGVFIVVKWVDRGFGELGEERLAILSLTLIVLGVQIIFTSFFLSILGLRRQL